MSDAEYACLATAVAERKVLPLDERIHYATPDAANACVAAALYWTCMTMWQDKPLVLVGGLGLATWQLCKLVLAAVVR